MVGFLRLIKFRTTPTATASSLGSLLHKPKIHVSGKFEPFKTLIKTCESPSRYYSADFIFKWKLHFHSYLRFTKSYHLGREFNTGRLLGISAVLGSFLLRPRFAHCIDGYDSSVDDHSVGMSGGSVTDDDPNDIRIITKKLMVPIALLFIVWMNWSYPVALGVKVILTLLSTKPSPFSVYVFIEQLQKQYRSQHPFLHKFKSLYAKKVEVEDYKVLCIAKVEIGDQKYTLIGLLGGWWVFELTSLRRALSAFKSRTLEILETAVSSDV